MSRATRAARLLWREWWAKNGEEVESLLMVLLLAPLLCWLAGALASIPLPHARETLMMPNNPSGTVAVGIAVIGGATVSVCVVALSYLFIRDTYCALRSAWERAGRDEQ